MSELRKCLNCGNLQARGQFCAKCGTDLSNVKPFIEDYAPQTKREEQSYGTLRFVSSLIVVIGWGTVVFAVGISCLLFGFAAGWNGAIVQGRGFEKLLGELGSVSSVFMAMLNLLFGTVAGLVEVAIGQLIMVFLDIRDDVRKISARSK